MQKGGVVNMKKQLTDIQYQEAKKYMLEGHKAPETARHFCISYNALRNRLIRDKEYKDNSVKREKVRDYSVIVQEAERKRQRVSSIFDHIEIGQEIHIHRQRKGRELCPYLPGGKVIAIYPHTVLIQRDGIRESISRAELMSEDVRIM
jgi:hypothetical protein